MRERFAGLRVLRSCRAALAHSSPDKTASASPYAGAVFFKPFRAPGTPLRPPQLAGGEGNVPTLKRLAAREDQGTLIYVDSRI
jgi:hypothetical protein